VLARIGYGISPSTITKNSIAPTLSSETYVIMPTSSDTFRATETAASSAGASALSGTAGPEHLPSSGNVGAVSSSCSGGCDRVKSLLGITLVSIVVLVV
jgi:hypothetical protein